MTIDIRIRGTEEECDAYCAWIRKTAEVRSISDWYPDTRKNKQSKLGRVYIQIGETSEELPKKKSRKKGQMQVGLCHFCHEEKKQAILMWDGNGGYAGVCPECAENYLDEQYVGNFIKKEHPEAYAQLLRKVNPQFKGVYNGPSGMQEIWDDGFDPLEGME